MKKQMNVFKTWVTLGRFFILPLLILFTLFPNALAGFNIRNWLLAIFICGSVWVAAHYFNASEDYRLGFDKIEGGSVAKEYTKASQIIPQGLFSVRGCDITALFLLLLSAFILFFCAPLRLDKIILYLLGVFSCLSYVRVFKVHKIGEVCWVLAFFAVGAFSYSLCAHIDCTAIAVGILLGMLFLPFYILDQLPDMKPTDKVIDITEIIFANKLNPSGFIFFGVTATYVIQTGFVLMNWLPSMTLLSIFSLPVAHICGVYSDYKIEKGAMLCVLWMTFYVLFATIGALL